MLAHASSSADDAIDIFLQELTQFQQELFYYTVPGVKATPHGTSKASGNDNFTHRLVKRGWIKPHDTNGVYIELERTIASFYVDSLIRKPSPEAYQSFIEAQLAEMQSAKERSVPEYFPESEILEWNKYEDLCRQRREMMKNADFEAAYMHLIIYSDLSKSPEVQKRAKEHFNIDPKLDTDEIMLRILQLKDEEIIRILPSFENLTANAKALLRKIYPLMLAIYGHIYFLEGGPVTLQVIAKALLGIPVSERSDALKLVFMAQFMDAAGAQGQMTMRGSVTCTNTFYEGYQLVGNTTFLLGEKLSANGENMSEAVTEAFNYYIDTRAAEYWVDFNKFNFDLAKKQFLVRCACSMRIFNKEIGQMLVDEFEKLDPDFQVLLIKQLGFDSKQGIDSWGITPHYFATVVQNRMRELIRTGKWLEAIQAGLDAQICVAMLIKEMTQRFTSLVRNPKRRLALGEVAFYAEKFPLLLKPENFVPAHFIVDPVQNKVTRPIDHYIFDLGKVFIDIDVTNNAIFVAFSKLAKKYNMEISTAEVKAIFIANKNVLDNFHKKTTESLDIPAFRKFIKDKLGLPANVSDEEFDEAYTASIMPNQEQTVAERLNYLIYLRQIGYKVYLLSNNNPIHRQHTRNFFDGANWNKYFDAQYFSNDYPDLFKPEATAFQRVWKEQKLNGQKGIFFDDLVVNVRAAQAAGAQAVVFTVANKMSEITKITAQKTQYWRSINVFSDRLLLWKSRSSQHSVRPATITPVSYTSQRRA